MRNAAIAVATLLTLQWAYCAEVLVIDDCEYADAAAAQAAWVPAEAPDPADIMARESEDGGKTALKMPCLFSREDVNRAVYDRDIELDLSSYGSITFDFYAEDVRPIRSGTIYFRSGEGWYGSGFSPAKGWKRVVIGRGSFGTEGTPAGWDKIDGVRICAWKALETDTVCGLDNLQARTEDIAVVRGAAEGGERQTALNAARDVSGYLDDYGIPHGVLTEEGVAKDGLPNCRLAIFAYSPGMSDEAVEQVRRYVETGGKIVVFYSVRPAIAELLGLGEVTYKSRDYDGEFASVAFEPDAIPGVPEAMGQESWNTQLVSPQGPEARVIGNWQDREGKNTGAAVVLSDNGLYMGHILTGSDVEPKRQFLMSVVGHFVPEAWKQAAANALGNAMQIGSFETRDDLVAFLRAQELQPESRAEVDARLAEAETARREAEGLLAAERYPQVITASVKLRQALVDAYVVAHNSRDGEFRAVWNHSGTGDCGTWDDAMQRLSAANFNAVVPNMWWGGVAHYDSEYLPHSRTFEERGDQIAQCVAAGKEHGIEVHPWKVNWNLGSGVPNEFVDKLRAEGRLQMSNTGEELAWLCPSHPDNYQLELDTMLEVVRKYDVDGVHFDYIRYSNGSYCYCDGCRQRFEARIGRNVENWPQECHSGDLREEYREFRRDNITRLVRATAEESRKIKPHVKISAAVFLSYPGCRDEIGQDWVLWCKEGWLDFVCPMNYLESNTAFESTVAREVGFVGGAVPLYSGIGAFIIPDDRVVAQVGIAREQGADGFIIFNMGESLANITFPKLARGVTSQKAILPHNGPIVTFDSAMDDSSSVQTVEGETLQVRVTLTSLGSHRVAATATAGLVVVQDMQGNALSELGALPGVGETVSFDIARTEGPIRLAAVGELTLEDGAKRPFIVRSRPYGFAEE